MYMEIAVNLAIQVRVLAGVLTVRERLHTCGLRKGKKDLCGDELEWGVLV